VQNGVIFNAGVSNICIFHLFLLLQMKVDRPGQAEPGLTLTFCVRFASRCMNHNLPPHQRLWVRLAAGTEGSSVRVEPASFTALTKNSTIASSAAI